jgi:CRP-like cAMP-binding protein
MVAEGAPVLSAAARAQALAGSSVFSGVPYGDLAALAELMRVESFAANAVVMEAGEIADCVYVVAEGSLSVFLAGSVQAVRRLRPGDVVGEYGIIEGSVRTATVRADGDCVLLSLDYERFREYLQRFPMALWVLFEDAVRRLLAAERRAKGAT